MDIDVEVDHEFPFKIQLEWMRDGNRYRVDTAGSLDKNGKHIAPIDPAIYLFDGREHWMYTLSPGTEGPRPELRIQSGPKAERQLNSVWYAGLCLDGVLYGDMEDVFTILLRQINSGTITVKPVTLDARECVHIAAAVPEGEYELWLDPAEGYRLRKSIVVKSGEQPLFDVPMSQSTEWSSVQATVTDIEIKDVLNGRLAVSGRMRIQGTPAEMSGRKVSAEGDLYTFSRSNSRFGTTLSAADIALKLPEGTQIYRHDK